jgi:pilus assembly protein CpaB
LVDCHPDPVTTTAGQDGRRVPWANAFRELRRAVSWHRRLLAGVLVAVAVLAGLQVVRPATVPAVGIVTAAHDLSAGTTLTSADLRLTLLPPELAPTGAARSIGAVLGARLASPLRFGEPLTDVRLVGPALLNSYRASIGADVGEVLLRVDDPGAVALLKPGDRIDVIAAPTAGAGAGGAAVVVAQAVPVLSVPAVAAGGTTGVLSGGSAAAAGDGSAGSVLLAVTPATARILAQAAVSSAISVFVHPD